MDAAPTAQPRQPIRLTLLGPIKGKAPCNPKNSEQRFMDTPDIVLNDGNVIPQIGLGVWTLNADETVHSLENAIAAGYRHFDTAMIYRNESAVGKSIARASVPREELFVTTKLWNSDHGYDATLFAYEATLKFSCRNRSTMSFISFTRHKAFHPPKRSRRCGRLSIRCATGRLAPTDLQMPRPLR